MLARDADSHPMVFCVSDFEAIHVPVGSKKGSSFFEDPAYFVFSEAVFLCNHYEVQVKLFYCRLFLCGFSFFLRDDMKFWISFWRFQTNRVARCQLVTTFLTTTFEDVSAIGSDSSSEESVFSETSAFLEFAEHSKKLEIAEKNMRIV